MKEVTIWDILTTSDDRCMVILLDEEGERLVDGSGIDALAAQIIDNAGGKPR